MSVEEGVYVLVQWGSQRTIIHEVLRPACAVNELEPIKGYVIARVIASQVVTLARGNEIHPVSRQRICTALEPCLEAEDGDCESRGVVQVWSRGGVDQLDPLGARWLKVDDKLKHLGMIVGSLDVPYRCDGVNPIGILCEPYVVDLQEVVAAK